MVDVKSGVLTNYVQEKVTKFSDHIRNCVLCLAKAYICEICGEGSAIFPFDEGCTSCIKCFGVFHRDCFKSVQVCPKCERRLQRQSLTNLPLENEDNAICDE